jgi:CheY-like chemotaxis protein
MKRILVVDDDPLVCNAIRVWLEEGGCAVFVANGGETGLKALDGEPAGSEPGHLAGLCSRGQHQDASAVLIMRARSEPM